MAKKKKTARPPLWAELVEAREKRGHTQAQAADLVGITQGSWSAIESKRKVPSRSLRKLLDLYIAGRDLS